MHYIQYLKDLNFAKSLELAWMSNKWNLHQIIMSTQIQIKHSLHLMQIISKFATKRQKGNPWSYSAKDKPRIRVWLSSWKSISAKRGHFHLQLNQCLYQAVANQYISRSVRFDKTEDIILNLVVQAKSPFCADSKKRRNNSLQWGEQPSHRWIKINENVILFLLCKVNAG